MRSTLIGSIAGEDSTTSDLEMRPFIHSAWLCSCRRARSGFFATLGINMTLIGTNCFPKPGLFKPSVMSVALTSEFSNAGTVRRNPLIVVHVSRHRSMRTSTDSSHSNHRRENLTIPASANFWVETGSARRKVGPRRLNEPLEEMVIMGIRSVGWILYEASGAACAYQRAH